MGVEIAATDSEGAPVARDFAFGGEIPIGIQVSVSANDIVSEFGSDTDSDLDATSLTFDDATINGGSAVPLSEIGFSFTPGADDAGGFVIDNRDAPAFADLAAGETVQVIIAFTVSDGVHSDQGTLTYTVSGTPGTYDVELVYLGANLAGQEVRADSAEGESAAEFEFSGDSTLFDIAVDLDISQIDGFDFVDDLSGDGLTGAFALSDNGSSATSATQTTAVSFAAERGSQASATGGSTAVASADSSSRANAAADGSSVASAEATKHSSATSKATGDSASSATADDSSDASASADGGSAAEATAQDESTAKSAADNTSIATAVAQNGSTATVLAEGSSDAVAAAVDGSIAFGQATDVSSASASATGNSDADSRASGESTSVAKAEQGSSAAAAASASSVAHAESSENGKAMADADNQSAASSTADDGGQAATTAHNVAAAEAEAANFGGPPDTAIAIPASVSGIVGSETQSTTISGLPAGTTLSAGSPNGDGTTWTFIGAPPSDLTLTPPAGYVGEFELTATAITTETTGTAVQMVTIFVGAPPVAQDDDIAIDEDSPITGSVFADNGNGLDSDPEGDPLTVTKVNGQAADVGSQITLASGALLTLNADGSFDYDPNGSFENLAVGESDTDTFTYRITDGNGGFDSATVTIDIDGVNDPPTAVDDGLSTNEDANLSGNVLDANGGAADSDIDGDPLAVTHVNGVDSDIGNQITLASGALLTLNADGSFDYDPNGAFENLAVGESDDDTFTYRITDGNGGFDSATVTIDIDGVNDPPTAVDDALSTDEDTSLSGNVFDANGGAASNSIDDGPFTSARLEAGAADGDIDDDPLAVTHVNGVASDIGNQITLASGALLTLYADGSFDYDPRGVFDDLSPDETDSDSFTYTIDDGNGGTDTATATIKIDGAVDVIHGTPLEDDLLGTRGDDEIYALASDDLIRPQSGSDRIEGSDGHDTVLYDGLRGGFAHDLKDDGTITVDQPGGYRDTLMEVERIDFNDGSLLYDVETPNLGFGYRIYQASFNRTPDEGGVLFWIGNLDHFDTLGWSQYEKEQFLATQFIQSDEFKDLFGANPTNEQYIDAMYLNVLDRLPDQGGYDFWVGGMQQGLTREDILIAFTKSDENVDRTAPDLDDGVWVV